MLQFINPLYTNHRSIEVAIYAHCTLAPNQAAQGRVAQASTLPESMNTRVPHPTFLWLGGDFDFSLPYDIPRTAVQTACDWILAFRRVAHPAPLHFRKILGRVPHPVFFCALLAGWGFPSVGQQLFLI